MFFLGFFFGYVVAKWKAIWAKLKAMMASSNMKKELNKANDKGAKDDDDKENEDEDEVAAAESVLDHFLSQESVPGLDDHAEIKVSPIMIYQVKRIQEERRLAELITALLKEREEAGEFDLGYVDGLSDAERMKLGSELMREQGAKVTASIGSVKGVARQYGATQNSMSILYSAGLTLARAKSEDDESAEKKLQAEVREKMKIVDKFLHGDLGFDVSRTKVAHSNSNGRWRIRNALEKANQTKDEPVKDIGTAIKWEDAREYAQRGRKRVAPPLDYEKGGATMMNAIRRGSVTNKGGGLASGTRSNLSAKPARSEDDGPIDI